MDAGVGGAGGGRSSSARKNLPFSKRYSADDLARLAQANRQAALSNMGMMGAQSLDEIVNQNNQEQQRRRRSFQQRYVNPPHAVPDLRTSMDFQSPAASDLDGYSFASSPIAHSPHPMNAGGNLAGSDPKNQGAQGTPGPAMSLDTQMGDFGAMDAMSHSPMFNDSMDPDTMHLDLPNNNFLDLPIDAYGEAMDATMQPNMPMFPQTTFDPQLNSQLANDGSRSVHSVHSVHGGGTSVGGASMDHSMMDKMAPQMGVGDAFRSVGSNVTSLQPSPHRSIGQAPSSSGIMPGASPHSGILSSQQSQSTFNPQNASGLGSLGPATTFTENQQQKAISQYLNAYSQSGFDMLGILMRVAARSKPQINIGAVDMSCAFVVCDVTQHDIPIVYCSEMFERLTGYVKHEILGRNCRFLQAPDGKVQSGTSRKYVDDKSVYYLKAKITSREEAQISLINYRKGGQPFMNLLTMIPIPWDTDEIRYIVGFQVDLVEQPTSITNKNPDGSYSINYQRGLLPRYVIHNTPETNRAKDFEQGYSIASDEVSSVLSTFGAGDNEYSKRIWDKIVIENTDDVVHVLSLKGLFLYISPAGKKVLEYEPSELVGTPLSSVCHPSDIVPVTRELKDTAPGSTVNVVFRIRRKHSGYTWFESHGTLHTEQGKGKKCIILTGRERPVYALQRKEIVNAAEIGDNELWTKMSTSGMFLFVSTHAKSLLDRQPEDLVGTSAQTLMRRESKEEFNRMLELARSGRIVTLKHDIQNRRGQTLHAQSTLYPGDAVEGTKPTFLIVQTKLLKMSRNTGAKSGGGSVANEGSSVAGSSLHTPGGAGMASASPVGNQFPHGVYTSAGGSGFAVGTQHEALAAEDNVFDELQTTRSTSWQFELRQMEKRNRVLAEELQSLNSSKKKRKRRKGLGQLQKDCANCHTRNTPEWRRGPSGNRDLCNSCGLRWAKQNGRVSPRTSSQHSDKASGSPNHSSQNQEVKSGNSISPMSNTKAAHERQMEAHAAKTSRMEAAKATSGYGGGISAIIDEGIEPAEG